MDRLAWLNYKKPKLTKDEKALKKANCSGEKLQQITEPPWIILKREKRGDTVLTCT